MDKLKRVIHWLAVFGPIFVTVTIAHLGDWRVALAIGLLLAWSRDIWVEAHR